MPTTGVVYSGLNGDAVDDPGRLDADHTMYRISKSSPTLSKHHGFPFLVTHGFSYRLIATSYDAAGRVASSHPIDFTC